jgi:hypothetical protein
MRARWAAIRALSSSSSVFLLELSRQRLEIDLGEVDAGRTLIADGNAGDRLVEHLADLAHHGADVRRFGMELEADLGGDAVERSYGGRELLSGRMRFDGGMQDLHKPLVLLESLEHHLRGDQGIHGLLNRLDALHAIGQGMKGGDVHLMVSAEANGVIKHLAQLIHQHRLVLGGFGAAAAPAAVESQGLLQGGKDIGVIHDQAAVFAGVDAIGPGDGLHQGVVAHRFVEVEGRAGRRVKAGEPHGADKHQPQRIGGVLEARIEGRIGGGEPAAMGFDVEAQGGHGGDLVLGGRHDDRHLGGGEDVQLPSQPPRCIEVVVGFEQGGSLSAAGAGC